MKNNYYTEIYPILDCLEQKNKVFKIFKYLTENSHIFIIVNEKLELM